MDPFTRAAVVAGLGRLGRGIAVPPAVLARIVGAFARYPQAINGYFHELVRAMIAQDARPAVVSTLLDVVCNATRPSQHAVALAVVSGRAGRGGAFEVVLQTTARMPRSYVVGEGTEGTRIAAILEHAIGDQRHSLTHSILDAWLARRDPTDPPIAAFVRKHALLLLASEPSEAMILALHRLVPSTGTWRAVANSLRARRATRKGERRFASDDT